MTEPTPSREDIRQQVEVVRESQRRVDGLLAIFAQLLALANKAQDRPLTAAEAGRLRTGIQALTQDAAESMAVRPPGGLNPDRAPNESPGPENTAQTGTHGAAVLTIVVTAPTQENAGQWAVTLRDLITAEHGDDMWLHMTISPTGTTEETR